MQCVPVRLGASRDTSSGCYSVLVLSALSIAGEKLLTKTSRRFGEHFPHDLPMQYQQLEPELVIELLLNLDTQAISLDQQAWLDIETFVLGYRQYNTCYLSL